VEALKVGEMDLTAGFEVGPALSQPSPMGFSALSLELEAHPKVPSTLEVASAFQLSSSEELDVLSIKIEEG